VAGNARAWCVTDDGAVDRVEPPDPARLAVGAERRVGRGGSWGSRPWEVRIGARAPLDDDTRNPFLGIRLVRRGVVAATLDG
ncbi:MAG: SUMF1/EgtB/PvdO family nonheme iron enzyme, partial [Planctomycetota bacterium]